MDVAHTLLLAILFAAGPLVIQSRDLKWESVAGYPPGYQRALLEGATDRAGAVTYRVRLPPNFRFEPHMHKWDEHVTVLSGTWYIGFGERFDESHMQALEAGSFSIIPAGTAHYVMTRDDGAICQIHGIGPAGLQYVAPAKNQP
jgi:quercetin dioxygenase-like cupin family protein